MEKIKVLIVEDQQILAEGIKSMLKTNDEIEVMAIANDGLLALEFLKTQSVDVVLMDIRMPNMNGVVATKEIKSLYPNTKVLILTTFDDSEYILSAINFGASGYLLKDINTQGLIDSIKNAFNGDIILPNNIAKKIADVAKSVSNDREIKIKKEFSLSDREVEIAMMIFENFTNRQISTALNISEGTTRNYISAIYIKLNALNRADAIKIMSEVIR